jgi:hypothetical protein
MLAYPTAARAVTLTNAAGGKTFTGFVEVVAYLAAALAVAIARAAAVWNTSRPRPGTVRQPKARQRHPGKPKAEFLQRQPPCCGLGQTFGQFVEFIIHTFPFVFVVCCFV